MSTSYREQLTRLVQDMALPNREAELESQLRVPSRPEHIKLFVDGNLDKRLDKLSRQLEFVAAQFEDFEALIVDYIRAQPLAALDSGTHDGDRMLAWLVANRELSPEQRDYVLCQRTRHEIEALAARRRLAYIRFNERFSLVGRFAERLESDPALQIYLNPIRRWARFTTAELLEETTRPPANVLFFAARGHVATALLELEGQTLINELADLQPCPLETWATSTDLLDQSELVQFCHDLATMGLICFG